MKWKIKFLKLYFQEYINCRHLGYELLSGSSDLTDSMENIKLLFIVNLVTYMAQCTEQPTPLTAIPINISVNTI